LVVSPEFVSAAVIKAIEGRRFEVVLPMMLALICWFKSLMPSLFRAIADSSFRHRIAETKET
jgi:hypothetical protein